MTAHNPPLDLLLDYAAGRLPEAVRLVVETHLDLCPESRHAVAGMEAVGGAMLETLEPVATSPGMLEALLDRLDADTPAPPAIADAGSQDAILPRALTRRLGRPFSELPWQRVAGLFDEAILSGFPAPYRVSLLRAKRGECVPMHRHLGDELLVVLAGGLRVGDAGFARGDFAYIGPQDEHEPVADSDEDCVCLLVLDAPLVFSGPHADVLNAHFRV